MIQTGEWCNIQHGGYGYYNRIQIKTILYGTIKHELMYFMKGLTKELEGTGVIAGWLSQGMMLTDFITKIPDDEQSEVIVDEQFRRIFNILADKFNTVVKFFIPRIFSNTRNDPQIPWLTNKRAPWRFIRANFRKDRLI